MKDTALLNKLIFCWKSAVLSVYTTVSLALTEASLRSSTWIGSGVMPAIGNVQHYQNHNIESLGFHRVDDFKTFFFPMKSSALRQLNKKIVDNGSRT